LPLIHLLSSGGPQRTNPRQPRLRLRIRGPQPMCARVMTPPHGAAPPALSLLQIHVHRHLRRDWVCQLDQVRHRHLKTCPRPHQVLRLHLYVHAHEHKLAFTSQNSILMGVSIME
jgi:hypothetical protein